MHKLLSLLLRTAWAAAKADCKQLPIVEHVTRGKTARHRDSSLRLNPIITPCKLLSIPTEGFASALPIRPRYKPTRLMHVSSSSLSLQLAPANPFSLSALSNSNFFQNCKVAPSLSMNKARNTSAYTQKGCNVFALFQLKVNAQRDSECQELTLCHKNF